MTATIAAPSRVEPPIAPTRRVVAVDALRGIAIALMVLVNLRGSDAMPPFLEHSRWDGFTLADAVFPVFLFVVGVSLTLASRNTSLRRAAARAAKLAVLGALLSALWASRLPRPTFGVLAHIAAASLLACLLLRLSRRAQAITVAAALAVLVVVGAVFGGRWGVAFDDRFFGGFTPEGPQAWLGSAATVWFGTVAGHIVRTHGGVDRRLRLVGFGGCLIVGGLVLSVVSPINKPLWSASFALVGAGVAAVALVLVEATRVLQRPFAALGEHAIAVYLFAESVLWLARAHLWNPVRDDLAFVFGDAIVALLYPSLALAACALLATVMQRRRLRLAI